MVVGLLTKENAPRAKRVLAVLVERDDLHRDVPGQRVVLELAQHGPAQHVRQEHVERHGGRLELLGQIERLGAAVGNQDLETLVAGEIDQNPRVMRVVLDDQENRIARLEVEAVVGKLFDDALLRRGLQHRRRTVRRGLQDARRHRRPGIFQRQIQREGRALARRRAQMDFTAEQARELAADGETKPGAAIFAAGAGVGLLERFEDQLLLLLGNADAGVGHFERDHRGGVIEQWMFRAPAAERRRHGHAHAALGGELERVGQQVLQHLLQAFGIRHHAAAEIAVDLDLERQMAVLGFVPERPSHGFQQVRGQDFLGIDRHGAGLDLRQIEDVADQVEQVGAGAMDGAGEFDLLVGQVAVGVFGELLAEDQDRVERRAQLVRHVGQEFRLVLRGQRQFGRLFLQRAAGLLDFLVLPFHFDVALGELLRLLLELLVGLLQFLLLGLQFAGELLRLLQQAFGLHRRLDRVEHDADAIGELLEEGHLRGGERRPPKKVRSRL